MNPRLTLVSLAPLALALTPLAWRSAAPTTGPVQAPDPLGLEATADGKLYTLWANDDLSCSFDFLRGRAAGRVVEGEIELDRAQIAFHVFRENMISFGFTRDTRVNVLDLGPFYVPGNRRPKDGAPKFSVSLFHTLFLDGAQFSYRGAGNKRYGYLPADRIFNPLPAEGLYHVEPQVGHTYLVRVREDGVGRNDALFKFQIVDFQPGQSLTIRWARVPVE